MIGELLQKLNTLLSRHKTVFFSILLLFISVLGFGISKLRVTESIFAALPKGKSFEEFNKLVESKSFLNQVIFSIRYDNETDELDAVDIAKTFSDSLKKHSDGLLSNIQYSRPDIAQEVYDYEYDHFPLLIDTAYYKGISEKIVADSVNAAITNVKNQLVSPGSSFFKQFLLNDPVGISSSYFKKLNAVNNTSGIIIEDGIMFSADHKNILITATTNYKSGNSEKDVALYNQIEKFKSAWNVKQTQNKLDYFGVFEISARNAMQVKKDSFVTMLFALGGILALLIGYYRKLLMPLFLTLPGIFGGLFALGITGYFRPEVSGISLATGAVVFGILLDYSFHFFTHLRHVRSIPLTIKEVSAPLLTGSFTTIMAFSALHFAKSAVLQDFGFFASLALLGAAFFTLVCLPILTEFFGIDYQTEAKPIGFKLPHLPSGFRKMAFWVMIGLTFVFGYYSRYTTFDSNFENLSIQNADLKNREKAFTGLNPGKEKRIYAFASATSDPVASANNYKIFQKLNELKEQGRISGFVSSALFVIPKDVQEKRAVAWNQYWTTERKSELLSKINRSASSNGFSGDAFDRFQKWLQTPATATAETSILEKVGMDNLVESKDGKTTYITPIVVPTENLTEVKAELRKISGTEIFDRGEMAGDLLTMVKDDFNYILFISAGVVFLTLLIVYGRIELALLTFLPMVVSWIWILGIAALLGIKFNFVNVVVTTFIFGLGDDYSIFVTEGLLTKYRDGKDNMKSYRSAIVLSALTTIIGTGTLILAEHPAIRSIATISMLGMACILLISFVFQPILFNFFVQKRIERKKAPVTFLTLLISISSFTYFLSGCLFLHSKLVTILLLPISKKRKKAMINRSLSFYAKTVIYSGPHVKKNFSRLENLNPDKPVIFIANHTSFLDILLAIMLNPKIVLMVKGWVYKSPFFGPIIRYAGYIYSESGTEYNIEKMRELIADGYSLLIFPEGTRSEDGQIGRFHKGAFFLAQELDLEIQPIFIHGASEVLPKNDFLISSGQLNVRVQPRLSNQNGVADLRTLTKSISAIFKSDYERFVAEVETPEYLRHRIFTNYVFKGPVLEWYFKAKWRLEASNFRYYNEVIGDRLKILDIGCGYGYLSFYLHYKNKDRMISGVDYDEEKISVAQNSYNKTANLQFFYENIMTYTFDKQDVIFLNDILHYLSKEKQTTLLTRCAGALSENGILFIRDGITDLKEKHKNTQLTEKLSTGIFSFNKKEDDFHFFSKADIKEFANQNGLGFEIIEHSSTTSNVLFVLRKPSGSAS